MREAKHVGLIPFQERYYNNLNILLREIFFNFFFRWPFFVNGTAVDCKVYGWEGGNIYACRLTRHTFPLIWHLFLIYKLVIVRYVVYTLEARCKCFINKPVRAQWPTTSASLSPQEVSIVRTRGLSAATKAVWWKSRPVTFFSISLTDKTILQTILPHR